MQHTFKLLVFSAAALIAPNALTGTHSRPSADPFAVARYSKRNLKSDEDVYLLATQVTDSCHLSDKPTGFGAYDPAVLDALKTSDDEMVRKLIPIAQDYDAIRLEYEIIESPARGKPRPQYGFEYDAIVEDAIPGLDLPFKGAEVRAAVLALRAAPRSDDIFEQGELGNWQIAITCLLRQGLRAQIRSAYENWARDSSDGPTSGTLPVKIESDDADKNYPVITNVSSHPLHHCMIVTKVYPDAEKIALLNAFYMAIDEQARGTMTDATVDRAKTATSISSFSDAQQEGRFVYVDELDPGATIKIYQQTSTKAKITASFWSDECTVEDVTVFTQPSDRTGN